MVAPWRDLTCFTNSSVIYFLSPIEKQNVILYAVLYLKKIDEELLLLSWHPHSAVGLTEFEEFASVESTDKEDSRCHQKRLTSMNAWTIWAL